MLHLWLGKIVNAARGAVGLNNLRRPPLISPTSFVWISAEEFPQINRGPIPGETAATMCGYSFGFPESSFTSGNAIALSIVYDAKTQAARTPSSFRHTGAGGIDGIGELCDRGQIPHFRADRLGYFPSSVKGDFV